MFFLQFETIIICAEHLKLLIMTLRTSPHLKTKRQFRSNSFHFFVIYDLQDRVIGLLSRKLHGYSVPLYSKILGVL